MRTHQVEVDDEVFAFVKSHAEPLVDTFNTSLKRLLPLPLTRAETPRRQGAPATDTHTFPTGTPQALRQIIEVAVLVLGGACTRQSATQAVAKRHGVAMQTVLDKYGRQLGLKTREFDELLDEPDHKRLKQLLRTKFPGYQGVIDCNLK